MAYDICGGVSSCIEAIHGAAERVVDRGLVDGVLKLAGGWCQQAGSCP
ncbi:hypothetical protein ODS41_08030 [Pyrobaculum sp. 3827-6]|nr:hypothetical protein [Pyrobaculum sp. 3827-6]MCU7787857.1 hypothetical protein [Pyrobaculum sp. 3827-6]